MREEINGKTWVGLKDIPIDKIFVKCDRCGTQTGLRESHEIEKCPKCGMRFDEMSSW